jgi:glutamine amidotransferase
MITVINYGAGNLPNVVRALEHVGARIHVTDQPEDILNASAIILPGVGATRDTMQSLQQLGIASILPGLVASKRPFLGICVGMQVLCTNSEEFGLHPCLDIVPGTVRRLPAGQKVPQIGWNQVHIADHAHHHPIFQDIPNESEFYFVHSYYCHLTEPLLIAGQTEYGLAFPSILMRDSLIATQFHPEKSGQVGLQLLQNFVRLSEET